MTKRVLVTGANGYIGTHVVQALLSCGCTVVACDVRTDHIPQGAEALVADIFDPNCDIYALAGKPACLIHLAWRNGFQHNADSHLQDLPCHVDFLKRMIDSGISSVSIMGSMHEVGYWEGAIDEHSPTNPLSFYGIAKNALRQAAELLTKNTAVTFHWLRGFYIYGDDERSNSVLGKITVAAKNGQKTFPFTSGKNLYDFISIDELARQIAAAATQDEITGIINCCSGVPISLGEMAERFIRDNHLQIKLEYGAFPDRAYDSPGVWGDATKIRTILSR